MLDFEEQCQYGRLCAIQEKMQAFVASHRRRLRFTALSMNKNKPEVCKQVTLSLICQGLDVEHSYNSQPISFLVMTVS